MFDINNPYALRNRFFVEKSLPRYLAITLFKYMYTNLNSCRVNDYENQWAECCSLATRLLNKFDGDGVHLIRRMDDEIIKDLDDEVTKRIGMYDNWNIISHTIRIPIRLSYIDYESYMLDAARVRVVREFVERFMR